MRPRYYELLRKYNGALKEKNALLKGYFNVRKKTFTRADNISLNDLQSGAQFAERNPFDNSRKYNEETMDIYDRQLADAGYEIIRFRKEFVERLSDEAGEILNKISGGREKLKISYKTSCDYIKEPKGRDVLYNQLLNNRDRDIYNGYAGIGPHRDDIEFFINGVNARKYGSQGQQRSVTLSLKLAEIRIAKQMLEESPVLLLDDVLSELDLERQKFLVSEIDDVQLFITSAELNGEVADTLNGGRIFRVKDGNVSE